jgi:uncharacterized coiled-coil protein SlyX
MNMPTPKLEPRKITTEERLASLEVTVEYLQSYISEIKGDIRRLNDKVDAVRDRVRDGGRSPKPL